MTTHVPYRCAFSGMSGPDADGYVVLMNTGNYPSFSNYLNETWTFNGTDWHNTSATLMDANGPLPGRSQQVFAYDGYNVMLYGGQGGFTGQIYQDTWTWNGSAWTKQNPATSPFGRFWSKASFLAGVGTVMFGGFGGAGNGVYLNETWIWDGYGLNWTKEAPATSPSARIGHTLAAGPSYVLMFGGVVSNGQFLNDTWKFDGTTWTQLSPINSPSARANACMSYDSVHGKWVLFGGVNQYNYLPETWTFDGTNWTQVSVANGAGPSGKNGAQMCFDTQSNTTILFGGISATDNYPANSTWSFNGTVWTKL